MFGDVNISAILDSFSVSYDKRVRPNYGGKYFSALYCFRLFYRCKKLLISEQISKKYIIWGKIIAN